MQDPYLPIELVIKTEKNPINPSPDKPGFEAKIEYLTFETIEDLENDIKLHEFNDQEDIWITPSICPSLNKKIPEIQIPQKMKISFDRLNGLINLNDKKASNYLTRKKIIIDQEHDLYRFEDNSNDEDEDLKTIKIFESKNKILFEINKNQNCKHYYGEKMNEDELELISLIKQLSKNSKSYLFVGNKMINNQITNVYRSLKKIRDITKIVTLYLQEMRSEINSDISKIVQVRIEEFHKINDIQQIKKSILYNFYEFESIKNDLELVKEVDLSECIDKSMIAEFSLFAKKIENINDPNKEELREGLKNLLIKTSDQTVLNFPIIQIDSHSEEVIANIKFVDIINPLAYFRKSTKTHPKQDKPDFLAEVENAMECASKTMKISHSK